MSDKSIYGDNRDNSGITPPETITTTNTDPNAPTMYVHIENPLAAELAKVRRERDELLEALLDCVNQACQVGYDRATEACYVEHRFLSTYEDALDLLEKLGHARDMGKTRYLLIWPEKGE